MARPTKYTPETVKKILDALAAGNTRKASALYAGVCESAFCRWLQNKAGFASEVENAEARAEVGHVLNIRKAAGDGTWTASAWWLERRRHQDWGKVDRVEIEIRRAAQQIAAAIGADPEFLIRRAQQLAAENSEAVTG